MAVCRKIFKNDGHLFVIDWQQIETPVGPSIDHRISKQTARETCENVEFTIEQSWKIYPFQYVLSFLNQRLSHGKTFELAKR